MKDINWFRSICADNGLVLSDLQASQFERYRDLLISSNRQLNLISRKDEENFYPNHALNSVSFLFRRRLKPDALLLDLGTGGGLPGIPIHIIYGEISIAFVDSIAKKTAALSAIIGEMGLEKSQVINARAEELAKKCEFQGRFDYVVSRAAGKLDEVAKWSHGFLRRYEAAAGETIPVGTLVVLKGGEFQEELRHTSRLKFIDSVVVSDTTFQGMDEIYNKEKKLVLITYKEAHQRGH